MQTLTEESALTRKTKELCAALVQEPEFQAIRQSLDTFLADDAARGRYDVLMMKGDALQQKQQHGLKISEEEIAEFEQLRDALMANAVAKDFLEAQRAMHKMQEAVTQYVAKTFELGRVPAPEDMDHGCGGGCGCH